VERKDLQQPGGSQDQYAAAFGGFNFMEFHGVVDATVTSLRVAPELIHELHRSLLLCYLGPRQRGDLIALQVESYRDRKRESLLALSAIKELTYEVREALLEGNLRRFAIALDEEWRQKQRLAEGITDPRIHDLEDRARKAGALAAKVLGAGGGGHLLLFVPPEQRTQVAFALVQGGGAMVDFNFVHRGAETWWAP
jgi:D-glycero-alpha-D-manno-heptose-7-phosphate kinase